MIPGVQGDSQVYLNGDFLRIDEARISVLDRGFIFGDGIYEVVPVYRGKAFRMAEHLNRLDRSLAALRIAQPHDRDGWVQLINELLARNIQDTCIVYLQVTRGVAKRDHQFPAQLVPPTVFGMVSPWAPPSAAQRASGMTAISIPDERWLHCEIKSVSLLGNVLAKQQAVDAQVDEVVQFRDGFLTEGSSTNIWVVSGGKLLAPPKNNLILEGIRYGLMGELAAEAGIPFESRRIGREEVENADELLLSSATKEVLPIVALDGKPVGSGKPGPFMSACARVMMPASPACKPAAARAGSYVLVGWRTTRDAWTGIATRVGFTSGFHHAHPARRIPHRVPQRLSHQGHGQAASRAGPDADRAGAAVRPGFDAATVEMRPSKGGNYMGLTFTVRATSREQLDALYRALHGHPMVSIVI